MKLFLPLAVALGTLFLSSAAEVPFSSECPKLDGVAPSAEARAAVEANERAFLRAVLAQDKKTLTRLVAPSSSFVRENGSVSTRQQFFGGYVSKGYSEAVSTPKEPMRQFCSTVFNVQTGHLRLKGQAGHPPTTVTHVWALQGKNWVLVHRHESHKGGPIGAQLTQKGAPNDIAKAGAQPTAGVAKIIHANTGAWVESMVTTNREVMETLIAESLDYVHVTAHTSRRADFFKELMGGYSETDFKDTTLRQYGNTVIALHNAHYRHTGLADQSRSQAMHAWVNQGGKWLLAARHSTRFEPY